MQTSESASPHVDRDSGRVNGSLTTNLDESSSSPIACDQFTPLISSPSISFNPITSSLAQNIEAGALQEASGISNHKLEIIANPIIIHDPTEKVHHEVLDNHGEAIDSTVPDPGVNADESLQVQREAQFSLIIFQWYIPYQQYMRICLQVKSTIRTGTLNSFLLSLAPLRVEITNLWDGNQSSGFQWDDRKPDHFSLSLPCNLRGSDQRRPGRSNLWLPSRSKAVADQVRYSIASTYVYLWSRL